MSIGSRIVARRKSLGWTQRELSRRAGLSPAYLCDLERDKRGVGVESLTSIADALGVSVGSICQPEVASPEAGELPLPTSLTSLAMTVGMTVREADVVHRLAIVARGRKFNASDMDWLRFYEAVKPFLG